MQTESEAQTLLRFQESKDIGVHYVLTLWHKFWKANLFFKYLWINFPLPFVWPMEATLLPNYERMIT